MIRKKARKIFNKVNRYAKSTSKAENLITADDDIVAVITREEVADKIINERLVNYSSNTLGVKNPEFTTLSIIYEATAAILENKFEKIDRTKLPSEADQKLYRIEAVEFWSRIVESITIFSSALHDPTNSGDDQRREIRATYTLGKPVVQFALVDAITRLNEPRVDGTRLGIDEICRRVNEVDWNVDNPLWQHVLMNGNKVVTGRQAARFAARFIAYLLGDPMEEKELEVLKTQYEALFGDGRSLPSRIHDVS